jgi:hypothetical protein
MHNVETRGEGSPNASAASASVINAAPIDRFRTSGIANFLILKELHAASAALHFQHHRSARCVRQNIIQASDDHGLA